MSSFHTVTRRVLIAVVMPPCSKSQYQTLVHAVSCLSLSCSCLVLPQTSPEGSFPILSNLIRGGCGGGGGGGGAETQAAQEQHIDLTGSQLSLLPRLHTLTAEQPPPHQDLRSLQDPGPEGSGLTLSLSTVNKITVCFLYHSGSNTCYP